MTQVWSLSTVHFMLQDPLKTIICKILNRKVCIFFKEYFRGKQDSIQFHVKSNFILICGHFSSLIVVEVGELRTEWIGSLHVSNSFPQVRNDSLAFPRETAVNLTLGARMTGTLIMNSFCWGLPFSTYFFFFTACSPEYEHSCLTKFTYFASLAYWPSFLYEKWNSNVKRQCQKDGMEMSQLVPYQVCEWGFILLKPHSPCL